MTQPAPVERNDYNEPFALVKQRVAIVERVMKLPYIKAQRDTEEGQIRFVARDDLIKAIHDYAVITRSVAQPQEVPSVAQAVKPSANYVNDPDYQADVLLAEADALKKFTDYFVANYPGPDTIIYDPHWHAPKIFRAAKAALKLVPAQPQEVPAPLTPFGEELRQKSFRDGVRSLRLLIREEMDKPLQNMPHTHNPDVQPEHQREYCWRCKIERVLDSQIEGYKVHCSPAAQEVPAEPKPVPCFACGTNNATRRMAMCDVCYRDISGVPAAQEVPAEQRQRTSTIAMGKMKPTELMAHEISLPEGELQQWCENPAAQPASAAKPAEDGLEAQLREHEYMNGACLCGKFSLDYTRAELDAHIKVHPDVDFRWWKWIGHIVPLIRTHQAARERELREKLEGLAALWYEQSQNYPLTNEAIAAQCAVRLCAKELRALLASHWPAHPPKTETPGSGE